MTKYDQPAKIVHRPVTGPVTIPKDTELFHGTLNKHQSSIEENGLIPRTGEFVTWAHGEDAVPLVYACHLAQLDKAEFAMRYYLSKELETPWTLLTHDQIVEHGLLVVVPRDLFTFNPNSYYEQPEVPIGAECNDWISTDTVEPLRILSGESIREFFEDNNGFKVTTEDTEVMAKYPEYADARMINFSDTIQRFRKKAGYPPKPRKKQKN